MSEVVNTSGITPLGRAVLVQNYEEEKKGVIELPDSVKDRVMMVEQRAVVIAVGAACWPDEPPRAKPGDRVLISKMAGAFAVGPKDGGQYRLINDRDIFAGLSEEI